MGAPSRVALAASVAWLVTSHLIIGVLPDSNQSVRKLLFQVMTSQAGTEIRPRVFYDRLFPNMMFLVMDTPTGADYWENVILADLSVPESPRVTFAEKGRLLIDAEERTVTFYLKNAELHQDAAKVTVNDRCMPGFNTSPGVSPETVNEVSAGGPTSVIVSG